LPVPKRIGNEAGYSDSYFMLDGTSVYPFVQNYFALPAIKLMIEIFSHKYEQIN
jgi:hypothetical protein